MNLQLRQTKTPHACLHECQLRFADVVAEVSKLAATPAEAAQVIDHMLRRRSIRFPHGFDPRRMSL